MKSSESIQNIINDASVSKNSRAFTLKTVTGSAHKTHVTRIGKLMSDFFDRMTRLLSYSSTRAYGALFTVFGGLSLIIHFLKAYLGAYEQMPIYILISSGLFLFFGILFLTVDKPMSTALQSMKITDFILFEFFCIRRMHKSDKEKGVHFSVGIVLGVLLAALSAFVPLYTVILGMGVLVYIFLTFMSPEFSFFSIFVTMPYLTFDADGILLASMVALTLISYARKVYLGKRVYFFERYDIGLFVMLMCILISGIFVKGVESFVSSIVMIILGCGYILASSLVTNRRLADCLINAIIVSAAPISVIAIVESVAEISLVGIENFEGASATFDKPYTLAMFLLISCTFSLYFANQRSSLGARILYAVLLAINLLALFFTMSMWAFAVVLFGIAAFGASMLRHGSGLVTLIIVFLPYALLFLPEQYSAQLMENPVAVSFGFTDSMSGWRTSLAMLRDHLFFGIGIGEDCFADEITAYDPGFSQANSGNFLLELALEAGVISLTAFLIIFIIRIRHRALYRPYIKNTQLSTLTHFTTACTAGLLVYGCFNYIWADMTVYYLFWCVFGLGSATLRVSRQEYDDRVAYFSDARAEDFSSIDVPIK